MTSETLHRTAAAPGWLRGQAFDTTFILGTVVLALGSGTLVLIEPALFWPILMLDLWLLGYHHVISTFTRLCFDKESFRENRFLVVQLPIIVLAAVFAIAHGLGIWALTTIYLYWQWFHYTRQSWGVGQVYRRKEDKLVTEDERFLKAAFYLLPLWGILYRSWQQPEHFLGVEVWTFPVPRIAVDVVGAAALATLALWAFGRWRMHRQGRLPIAHTTYMASHIAIFATGYLLMEDITFGWLVINIWHNAQYVLFVWLFNTKKYDDGEAPAPGRSFIARISQARNWPMYFGFCLLLTFVLYQAIAAGESWFALVGLAPMVILYQTINFHHYIVDSIIWKVRKPKMRETLGIDHH